MKNWLRVFLTCFVLIGGTAFFAYYFFKQFNKELDTLSASYSTIASLPPVPFPERVNNGKVLGAAVKVDSATTTPIDSASSTESATSTDEILEP